MKKLWIVLLIICFNNFNCSVFGQNEIVSDTINVNDSTIDIPEIRYTDKLSFIKYGLNFIEWYQADAMFNFFQALKNSDKRKARVLHIGDSHLQSDYYTGVVRNKIQEVFGYGGRGFVFPYKSAGTHSAYDYKSVSSGKWEYSRNVLRDPKFKMGITGAAIYTTDTAATFGINFYNKFNSIKSNFVNLKIFCKQDSSSFNLLLYSDNDTIPIQISNSSNPNCSYIEVHLPKATNSLNFSFSRTDTVQTNFECYGILIESNSDNGILYSSVGINGAGYNSILKENLLEKQLAEYQPDLVILDVGANDFYPFTFNNLQMERNLDKIIKIIRTASPQTSILLSNSHDLYKRRRNIAACSDFSNFTREMAKKHHCGLYDYYNISGGRFSMLKWKKAGLAQRDKVHLTHNGYALKAELFFNALLNSYTVFNEKMPDLLVKPNFVPDTTFLTEVEEPITSGTPINENISIVKNTNQKPTTLIHIVKKGENLSTICEKYSITISEITEWNKLKTNHIFAGQKLYVAPKTEPKNNKTGNNFDKKPIKSNKIIHTVKSGETLSAIAVKYNTTVQKIKKSNRLKNNTIINKQRLVIE